MTTVIVSDHLRNGEQNGSKQQDERDGERVLKKDHFVCASYQINRDVVVAEAHGQQTKYLRELFEM